MQLFYKIIILKLTFLAVSTIAFDNGLMVSSKNATNTPYCFRFTWLGPKYNNESYEALSDFANLTCDDLDISKKDPCRRPLVVSDNGNIPDTSLLWKEMNIKGRFKEISCQLIKGEVCAKITYTYNQNVENITYMCTKISLDGEGAAPNGCYLTDHGNGKQTEVCACESSANRQPCNNANRIPISTYFHTLVIIMVLWLT